MKNKWYLRFLYVSVFLAMFYVSVILLTLLKIGQFGVAGGLIIAFIISKAIGDQFQKEQEKYRKKILWISVVSLFIAIIFSIGPSLVLIYFK